MIYYMDKFDAVYCKLEFGKRRLKLVKHNKSYILGYTYHYKLNSEGIKVKIITIGGEFNA